MQSLNDKTAFNVGGFSLILFYIAVSLALFLSLSSPTAFFAIGIIFIIIASGFTIISPNEARVIIFFGKYVGTIKKSGFLWVVPFSSKTLIPLKIINFSTEKLKVNDLSGNPVEIGAIVVWYVEDAAQACFNVDDYKQFVFNQSESVVRTVSAKYPYDSEKSASLRGSADEIAKELVSELQKKLNVAGIKVREVRLSHLAYAPEIASAMLKRQQAVAILESREYLIRNAAGIVEDVIDSFVKKGVVNFSDDKKIEIIGNILIAIISDQAVTPVIGVGS